MLLLFEVRGIIGNVVLRSEEKIQSNISIARLPPFFDDIAVVVRREICRGWTK